MKTKLPESKKDEKQPFPDENPTHAIRNQLVKSKKQREEEEEVRLHAILASDLKRLTDDFDDEFGADKRKGNTYYFPNKDEAKRFLKAQADKGVSFFLQAVGKDEFYYSDGKGCFKVGTSEEVKSYVPESLKKHLIPPPEVQKEEEPQEEKRPRI